MPSLKYVYKSMLTGVGDAPLRLHGNTDDLISEVSVSILKSLIYSYMYLMDMAVLSKD